MKFIALTNPDDVTIHVNPLRVNVVTKHPDDDGLTTIAFGKHNDETHWLVKEPVKLVVEMLEAVLNPPSIKIANRNWKPELSQAIKPPNSKP